MKLKLSTKSVTLNSLESCKMNIKDIVHFSNLYHFILKFFSGIRYERVNCKSGELQSFFCTKKNKKTSNFIIKIASETVMLLFAKC